MLEEQRLDTKAQDCAAFDCGDLKLNDYLRRQATQDRRRNLTHIYVLVDRQAAARVLGYYTLSAAQVDAKSFYEHSGLPRFLQNRYRSICRWANSGLTARQTPAPPAREATLKAK